MRNRCLYYSVSSESNNIPLCAYVTCYCPHVLIFREISITSYLVQQKACICTALWLRPKKSTRLTNDVYKCKLSRFRYLVQLASEQSILLLCCFLPAVWTIRVFPWMLISAVYNGIKMIWTCNKVKQSHYRPWQALRFPKGWDSQILRQSAHEGGKVVSLTQRPPLPPGNIPGTHFC
jgi:hypothetical protein